MEIGTIEREIHIEASPEVVYQVVSTPEHLREWWPEDAELDAGARRHGPDHVRPGPKARRPRR